MLPVQETALRDLHPLDPLRLSVAVNFSVFLADLVHSPSGAITLAQAVSRRLCHTPVPAGQLLSRISVTLIT
jgi:hypothetical protein